MYLLFLVLLVNRLWESFWEDSQYQQNVGILNIGSWYCIDKVVVLQKYKTDLNIRGLP